MNRPDTDALPSAEELMAQYAALVWKTAAAYLENPDVYKRQALHRLWSFHPGMPAGF